MSSEQNKQEPVDKIEQKAPEEPFQKQINLSNSEVRKNFQVVSSFLYTITKSESYTDLEFQNKFEVYETLLFAHQRWGRNAQFGALAGVVAYCLKGNNIPLKLTAGFLYGFWIQHFYTLGSYFGLSTKLPWAINKLDMGSQYETTFQMRNFLVRLKEREDQYARGEKTMTDNDLVELMFKEKLGDHEAKKIFEKSHVANDYFEKNMHKYTKVSPDDSDPLHILAPHQSTDEMLRLKYFDSFLTRYVYHGFTRWFQKAGAVLGITDQ